MNKINIRTVYWTYVHIITLLTECWVAFVHWTRVWPNKMGPRMSICCCCLFVDMETQFVIVTSSKGKIPSLCASVQLTSLPWRWVWTCWAWPIAGVLPLTGEVRPAGREAVDVSHGDAAEAVVEELPVTDTEAQQDPVNLLLSRRLEWSNTVNAIRVLPPNNACLDLSEFESECEVTENYI